MDGSGSKMKALLFAILFFFVTLAVGHCEESLNIYNYLWDDDNYPCIARFNTAAWHLDKTSVYVEMEEPPQYILHVHVLRTPQLHYNDILPECTESYRILFNKEEGAMYEWLPQEEWHYLSLDKKNNGDASCVPLYAGEAAFYLTYGERFYDVAPLWFHRPNPWFKKHDKEFYDRLDGAES